MSRETRVPAIPAPSDSNVIQTLQAIKGSLDVREGRLGDPLDQFVSLREMKALGLVADGSTSVTSVGGSGRLPVIGTGGTGFGPGSNDETADLTPPPQPTGLTAVATLTNVFLSWNGAAYSNHAYTQVWRSETNVLGSAVMVGTTIGSLYSDPVRENTTYYYWIRFVSMADVIGPYNATNGTQVTTGQDPSRLLQILTGQITASQLYQDLGARIDLIDGPTSLAGSVAARIYAEELARIAADTSLGSSITTLQSTTATQATQITSLTTRTTAAESSIVSLQNTTATQATTISSLSTRVGSAESSITNLQSTTATQASSISSLTTRVGSAETSITNLQTTTANQATSISQLTSSVNGNTSSIQTLTSTTNGLSSQYTVKVDTNGYVSGFGLASTANTGTPTSSFIVRADSFAIGSPSGPGISPSMPFIVRTTPTTINGESVPAGVYINSAWIQNGTITSAQITTLTATKITAGTITAAIDMQSPVIRSGNVIPGNAGFYLGEYGGVNRFYIGNGTTGINGRSLEFNGTNAIVRGGLYAYFGEIGQILIDVNGLSSSNYVSGVSGFSLNASGAAEFQNVTVRGNVQATSLASGTAMVQTANIVDGSITTAKIGDAQITSAKIGNAEVGTLKIGGNAVTVPIYNSSFVDTRTFTSSWYTVMSMTVPISGLQTGEYVGLIVNSVSSVYPADSVATDIILGIFINGVLMTELAASIDYYGFSHAGAGYALVTNGSNSVEFKYRANNNKQMTIVTYATALAGKR